MNNSFSIIFSDVALLSSGKIIVFGNCVNKVTVLFLAFTKYSPSIAYNSLDTIDKVIRIYNLSSLRFQQE